VASFGISLRPETDEGVEGWGDGRRPFAWPAALSESFVMVPRKKKPGDNPAQIKGDIARGRTAGKRPGYDPGVSSIETDSEAGGFPLTPEQVRAARETQRIADGSKAIENAGHYADAMQSIVGAPPEQSSAKLLLLVAVVMALMLVALFGALLLLM